MSEHETPDVTGNNTENEVSSLELLEMLDAAQRSPTVSRTRKPAMVNPTKK